MGRLTAAVTAVAATAVAATVLVSSLGLAPPSAAHGSGGDCDVDWGSMSKGSWDVEGDSSRLAGVRSGRHACFDRVVVDLADGIPAYEVAYVDEVVGEGTGEPMPLRGGAFLQVRAISSPFADGTGDTRLFDPADPAELVDTTGYETLRQVGWTWFEGHSVVGVGVRARLPFRVVELDGPGGGSRLVVDIAHHW